MFYEIPVTTASLISLIEGPAFRILRLDLPWREPRLANPVWAYVGGNDPLQVDGPVRMARGLHERLANVKVVLVPRGDHHLRPVQDEVLKGVATWIGRRRTV